MQVTDALIRAAFGDAREQVNISSLARTVGTSPQTLHRYWTGRSPWPADVALAVLAASGRLRLEGGELRLQGAVPPPVWRYLAETARQGFGLKEPSRKVDTKQRITRAN